MEVAASAAAQEGGDALTPGGLEIFPFCARRQTIERRVGLLPPPPSLIHPIYSAVAALWLGAALGALNWILLVLWPMIVVAVTKSARAEEETLRAKFGDAYDAYAEKKGRLVPRLWG